MSHGYWPVTHVTHTDLLTHVTHDPLTHCQLWPDCQITFFTAAAYNGGGGGDTTRTLKLVKSPSSANQHLVFTGQMLILSPNQRYQGSEGKHKPSTGHLMSAYYHQRICVFALEQETEFETMKTLVHPVCVVQSKHITCSVCHVATYWHMTGLH